LTPATARTSPVSEPATRSRQRKARKYALDILFTIDLTGASLPEALETYATMSERELPPYSRRIAEGVTSHEYLIDGYLAPCLSADWTVERMPAIDRCLARIAVWEMVYADVPPAVAISEAQGLAGELSTDSSPGFLAGVLGQVAKLVTLPPLLTRTGDEPDPGAE